MSKCFARFLAIDDKTKERKKKDGDEAITTPTRHRSDRKCGEEDFERDV